MEVAWWFFFSVFFGLVSLGSCFCSGQCSHFSITKDSGVVDRALEGFVIIETTAPSFGFCFQHCIDVCRCVSFNYQPGESRICQLNHARQKAMLNVLRIRPGFRYYEIGPSRRSAQSQKNGCSCSNGCCNSRPCQNNGTCIEKCETLERFECVCRKGYKGKRCEFKKKTRYSCLDYLRDDHKASSGVYAITNSGSNKDIDVFCDMDVAEGRAWTLVMSYSLANNARFANSPLTEYDPVCKTSPQWEKYRLGRLTMQSIASQSSEWRATCGYPTRGIDFRDYASASFSSFNLLNYRDVKCKKFTYINIRGSNCSQCTALANQAVANGNDHILHVTSGHGVKVSESCDFKPASGAKINERSFGYYSGNINPEFRCTAHMESTTEWWFGGTI